MSPEEIIWHIAILFLSFPPISFSVGTAGWNHLGLHFYHFRDLEVEPWTNAKGYTAASAVRSRPQILFMMYHIIIMILRNKLQLHWSEKKCTWQDLSTIASRRFVFNLAHVNDGGGEAYSLTAAYHQRQIKRLCRHFWGVNIIHLNLESCILLAMSDAQYHRKWL